MVQALLAIAILLSGLSGTATPTNIHKYALADVKITGSCVGLLKIGVFQYTEYDSATSMVANYWCNDGRSYMATPNSTLQYDNQVTYQLDGASLKGTLTMKEDSGETRTITFDLQLAPNGPIVHETRLGRYGRDEFLAQRLATVTGVLTDSEGQMTFDVAINSGIMGYAFVTPLQVSMTCRQQSGGCRE